MKVLYGKAVYGKEEIAATIDVLKNKSISLIDGPSVKELEKFLKYLVKNRINVNSGSLQIYLLYQVLILKKGRNNYSNINIFYNSLSNLSGRMYTALH